MTRIALVVPFLGLVAGGCSRIASPPAPERRTPCMLVPSGYGPEGTVSIDVETVVTGLEVPWGIAFLPDGDWLVTERAGRVRLVTKGQLVPEPVVTIPVVDDGRGGLLGIAASPDFQQNRRFYVVATFLDTERHHRVLRYELSADHRSAVLDKVIVDRIPGVPFHEGGRLRFGPDGMLYLTTGDAREPALSPSPGSLGGKLLRFTPEGGIPSDNPHGMSPVFVSGLRGSQGFDWYDPRFLVVADQGLGGHDEVDVTVSGLDLGWPAVHGCQTVPGKVPPSLTWDQEVQPAGAAFYRGGGIPEWTGSLLIGTLASRHLHRVVFNPQDPRKVLLHEVYLSGEPPAGHGRLREVLMGPGGDLYVTTSNCDGLGQCPLDKDRVLRITRGKGGRTPR